MWLGVTAENQEHYDKRWPILANLPAQVRFISHEPALGPLDIKPSLFFETERLLFPDWVITGGESGPGARPYNPTWAKDVVELVAVASALPARQADGGLRNVDFLRGFASKIARRRLLASGLNAFAVGCRVPAMTSSPPCNGHHRRACSIFAPAPGDGGACDEADTHHDVWCPEPRHLRREARKSGTREKTKRTALIASA